MTAVTICQVFHDRFSLMPSDPGAGTPGSSGGLVGSELTPGTTRRCDDLGATWLNRGSQLAVRQPEVGALPHPYSPRQGAKAPAANGSEDQEDGSPRRHPDDGGRRSGRSQHPGRTGVGLGHTDS